jgi:hypothetical protein
MSSDADSTCETIDLEETGASGANTEDSDTDSDSGEEPGGRVEQDEEELSVEEYTDAVDRRSDSSSNFHCRSKSCTTLKTTPLARKQSCYA